MSVDKEKEHLEEERRELERYQSLRLIVQDYLTRLDENAFNDEDILRYSAMSARMAPAAFLDVVNREKERLQLPT
jgi:hypothetical protein